MSFVRYQNPWQFLFLSSSFHCQISQILSALLLVQVTDTPCNACWIELIALCCFLIITASNFGIWPSWTECFFQCNKTCADSSTNNQGLTPVLAIGVNYKCSKYTSLLQIVLGNLINIFRFNIGLRIMGTGKLLNKVVVYFQTSWKLIHHMYI